MSLLKNELSEGSVYFFGRLPHLLLQCPMRWIYWIYFQFFRDDEVPLVFRAKWEELQTRRCRQDVSRALPLVALTCLGQYLGFDLRYPFGKHGNVMAFRLGCAVLCLAVFWNVRTCHWRSRALRQLFGGVLAVICIGQGYFTPLMLEVDPSAWIFAALFPFICAWLATSNSGMAGLYCIVTSIAASSFYFAALPHLPVLLSLQVVLFVALMLSKDATSGREAMVFSAQERQIQKEREASERDRATHIGQATLVPAEWWRQIQFWMKQRKYPFSAALDEVRKPRVCYAPCSQTDIRGFTRRMRDSNYSLHGAFPNIRMCSEIIAKSRGVATRAGDGIFALYPDRKLIALPLVRAARGAIELLQKTSEWNQSAKSSPEEKKLVERRICIAFGSIRVGNIGGYSLDQEINALGLTTALPMRMDEFTKKDVLKEALRSLDGGAVVLSDVAARGLKLLLPELDLRAVTIDTLHEPIRDFELEKTVWLMPASAENYVLLNSKQLDAYLQSRTRCVVEMEEKLVEMSAAWERSYADTPAETAQGSSPETTYAQQKPRYTGSLKAPAVERIDLLPVEVTLTESGAQDPLVERLKVLRASPFGFFLVAKSGTSLFKKGAIVKICWEKDGVLQEASGIIVDDKHSGEGAETLAVRLNVDLPVAGRATEMRAQARWSCPQLYRPAGFAANPSQSKDIILFEVIDISRGGMQITTSVRNKHLVSGMNLDCTVSCPMIGDIMISARIGEAHLTQDSEAQILMLNMVFVNPSVHALAVLGSYALQFSEIKTGPSAEKDLAWMAATTGAFAKYGVRATFVRTLPEYHNVIRARAGLFAANEMTVDLAAQHCSGFDARARLLVLEVEGVSFATCRLKTLDLDDEMEAETIGELCDETPRRDEVVEISGCTIAEGCARDTASLLLMLCAIHYARQTSRPYIIGEISGGLSNAFLQEIEAEKAGLLVCNKDNKREIFLLDVEKCFCSSKISAYYWFALFYDSGFTRAPLRKRENDPAAKFRIAVLWLAQPFFRFCLWRAARRLVRDLHKKSDPAQIKLS